MNKKLAANVTTRYIVDYDHDAEFEEINGKGRPLTAEEYRGNEYRKDGKPVSYAEYRAYYGNPEKHVYLEIVRQDRCPCCNSWAFADALCRIDFMIDDPEADQIGTFTRDELIGYLAEVADDLEPAVINRKGKS